MSGSGLRYGVILEHEDHYTALTRYFKRQNPEGRGQRREKEVRSLGKPTRWHKKAEVNANIRHFNVKQKTGKKKQTGPSTSEWNMRNTLWCERIKSQSQMDYYSSVLQLWEPALQLGDTWGRVHVTMVTVEQWERTGCCRRTRRRRRRRTNREGRRSRRSRVKTEPGCFSVVSPVVHVVTSTLLWC